MASSMYSPVRVLIEMNDGEVIEGIPISMAFSFEEPQQPLRTLDGERVYAGATTETIELTMFVTRRTGRGTNPDLLAEKRRKVAEKDSPRRDLIGDAIAGLEARTPVAATPADVEKPDPSGRKKPEEKTDALLTRFLNMDLEKKENA